MNPHPGGSSEFLSANSLLLKVYQNSEFEVFWLFLPHLLSILNEIFLKILLKVILLAVQCSHNIHSFKIFGTLTEHIHCKLRGPPVSSTYLVACVYQYEYVLQVIIVMSSVLAEEFCKDKN